MPPQPRNWEELDREECTKILTERLKKYTQKVRFKCTKSVKRFCNLGSKLLSPFSHTLYICEAPPKLAPHLAPLMGKLTRVIPLALGGSPVSCCIGRLLGSCSWDDKPHHRWTSPPPIHNTNIVGNWGD